MSLLATAAYLFTCPRCKGRVKAVQDVDLTTWFKCPACEEWVEPVMWGAKEATR